jgi:hypothetical protein
MPARRRAECRRTYRSQSEPAWTAGFANDVEDVNQYAAVMWVPTAKGTADEQAREHPQIIDNNPNVAMNSLHS